MRYLSRKTFAASCAAVWLVTGSAMADPVAVDLHVDSAPNVYGSPAFAPWWSAAKSDVVAGTFTDMRNGTVPGTHDMHPSDEIVYSYGDLGKRIHWIYWINGATKAGLDGLFEVKWSVDWDAVEYTWDWGTGALIADGAELGWIQPGSWEDYSGGVIGSFAFAWWAVLPQTPGELATEILQYQTHLKGMVRIREDLSSGWSEQELNLTMIPLPAPIGLAGVGLLGLGGISFWRKRARV